MEKRWIESLASTRRGWHATATQHPAYHGTKLGTPKLGTATFFSRFPSAYKRLLGKRWLSPISLLPLAQKSRAGPFPRRSEVMVTLQRGVFIRCCCIGGRRCPRTLDPGEARLSRCAIYCRASQKCVTRRPTAETTATATRSRSRWSTGGRRHRARSASLLRSSPVRAGCLWDPCPRATTAARSSRSC